MPINPESMRQLIGKRLIRLSMSSLRVFSFLTPAANHKIGYAVGGVLHRFFQSRRKITQVNLRLCFPELDEGDIDTLSKNHFRKFVTGVLMTSYAWWSSSEKLENMCTYTNREILDEQIAANKTVIVLAPHFCSTEFLGPALCIRYPGAGMYKRHKNPVVDQFLFEKRSRFGGKLYNFKNIPPSLIKSLRKKTPFYYLPDQDSGNKGVFAQFYGISTATFPSVGKLARLTDAVVVPCMAKILDRGAGVEIIFHPPINNFPAGDLVDDASRINKAIEELITHAPEQYLWCHRRFKTRPPGQSSFY